MTSSQLTCRFACLFTIILFLQIQPLLAQHIPPLAPINEKYKFLQEKNVSGNNGRHALDTIQFPWAEYSKGALGNALWRTVYLLPSDETKLPGLVKFPANSSDKTRAELDYLLKLQNSRTKQEVARAEYIANIGSWPNIVNPTDPDYEANREQLFYIVSTTTGKKYDFKEYPATTTLLMNCIQDIRVTEFRLKRFFKRPRPYHLDTTLHPLTRINSPSFPSGHSLWAYTEAYVFGQLLPSRQQDFLNAAAEVQWSRELMGIHYPSDNDASRILGWHLLKYWYNNPRFVADLNNAQKEWTVGNINSK
jgi:acid phosphatase (class A)